MVTNHDVFERVERLSAKLAEAHEVSGRVEQELASERRTCVPRGVGDRADELTSLDPESPFLDEESGTGP